MFCSCYDYYVITLDIPLQTTLLSSYSLVSYLQTGERKVGRRRTTQNTTKRRKDTLSLSQGTQSLVVHDHTWGVYSLVVTQRSGTGTAKEGHPRGHKGSTFQAIPGSKSRGDPKDHIPDGLTGFRKWRSWVREERGPFLGRVFLTLLCVMKRTITLRCTEPYLGSEW